MASARLADVFSELFTAPLRAVQQADEAYLRMWALWLEKQLNLVERTEEEFKEGLDFEDLVRSMAPVVELEGAIEVAVTMRIASVREFDAELGVGVMVGPVYSSGSFGFAGTTAEESLFQASTKYILSNTQRNLAHYLDKYRIPIAKPSQVREAVRLLREHAAQSVPEAT